MKMARYMKKTAERYWTEEEDNILREIYSTADWDEILEALPKRNRATIHTRASALGIKRTRYFWSEEDKSILRDNYGKVDSSELYELLDGRYSVKLIRNQAKKMGLTVNSYWSDDEINILKNTYEVLSFDEVLKLLPGRTYDSIVGMARKLGIKSSFTLNNCYSDDGN